MSILELAEEAKKRDFYSCSFVTSVLKLFAENLPCYFVFYDEIIEQVNNTIGVINQEQNYIRFDGKRVVLSNKRTTQGRNSDYEYARSIIKGALKFIFGDDFYSYGIIYELSSRHPFFIEDYIAVFLYSECSIELFNSIYFYSHFYAGTVMYDDKMFLSIKNLLIDLTAKEILDIHNILISEILKSKISDYE